MNQTPSFSPQPGIVYAVEEGLRMMLAPNPSPMTERGTNTWLLGEGAVTLIDPGPASAAHLQAILDALAPGEHIAQILVSHSHLDHSPAARPLAEATGAPVLAYGDSAAGRSVRMQALAGQPIGGGEGIDSAFAPDEYLADGAEMDVGGLTLRALHTPGHLGNHLSFLWGQALFSGDQVMGWAPSLVSPPDGDLTDFMASLDRLEALGPTRLYPGHGAPVADGPARIAALRAHRLGRERAILDAINAGAGDAQAITAAVYTDVPPAVLPVAARNVLAHLIDLEGRGLIGFDGPAGLDCRISAAR
ncbi:MBL fold metallo-hydrolase [Pararhodobacter sp.]|uniref:MBL fold metallo-hydrolase n=1 Tax=Pararhodobacter sp. TaxID=2127056 RepID=UPI002FDCB483